MQPLLKTNDLALVRTQTSYHVGDVVLYQSALLHKPVLHRIVAIQHGDYFFRGDNNDFVDPGYATRTALIGKLWVHVPLAGAVIEWLGQPLHAGLLAGLAALLVVLSGGQRDQRRRRRRHVVAEAPAWSAQGTGSVVSETEDTA